MRILNNTHSLGYYLFNAPFNINIPNFISSLNTINIINNSISSYNSNSNIYGDLDLLANQSFSFGPNSLEPNPSAEFLNLNLSLNTAGTSGGSYAWTNINPTGISGFGQFTGSKARITYLNLPTQIFDPSNIRIKAKAVHGN